MILTMNFLNDSIVQAGGILRTVKAYLPRNNIKNTILPFLFIKTINGHLLYPLPLLPLLFAIPLPLFPLPNLLRMFPLPDLLQSSQAVSEVKRMTFLAWLFLRMIFLAWFFLRMIFLAWFFTHDIPGMIFPAWFFLRIIYYVWFSWHDFSTRDFFSFCRFFST